MKFAVVIVVVVQAQVVQYMGFAVKHTDIYRFIPLIRISITTQLFSPFHCYRVVGFLVSENCDCCTELQNDASEESANFFSLPFHIVKKN